MQNLCGFFAVSMNKASPTTVAHLISFRFSANIFYFIPPNQLQLGANSFCFWLLQILLTRIKAYLNLVENWFAAHLPDLVRSKRKWKSLKALFQNKTVNMKSEKFVTLVAFLLITVGSLSVLCSSGSPPYSVLISSSPGLKSNGKP